MRVIRWRETVHSQARPISRVHFKKALGYLIGEKLLNHIRASDSDPSWAATLPLFATEIKRIFTAEQLAAYFATTTRVGPAAHVAA